ncbi:MAG TPA: hypothetical protein DCP28_28070, partial [Cytophagales bacterium]|nr:hypothetical protein [Cytophagales bacterium]
MKNLVHIGLCLAALCLGITPQAAWAQPTQFDEPTDVILFDPGTGDTVALVSAHNTLTQGLSTAASGVGETMYLGDLLAADINGKNPDRVYVFANRFEQVGQVDLQTTSRPVIFGRYDTFTNVEVVRASDQAYLSKIDVTWVSVTGADGYLIFRDDQPAGKPYRVITDEQLTTFTDTNLGIDQRYTYSVLAYSLDPARPFITEVLSDEGSTQPFTFAYDNQTVTEVSVDFNYEFDNHLLVGLDNQAVYVELVDETAGQVVFGDQLTLTDIAENDLLFDNSLKVSGQDEKGVSAETNIGSLPQWTIEMWVNPSLDAGQDLYTYLFQDGDVWSVITPTGYVYFTDQNDLTLHSQDGAIAWDTWSHIAMTYDGSEMRLYINGEPMPWKVYNGATPFDLGVATANGGLIGTLNFGGVRSDYQSAAWHQNFTGAFGMLRIWDKPRLARQVAEDYQDVFDTDVEGLVSQWTFDQEDLSLADDIHGNILTLSSNAPQVHPVRWKPAYAFVDQIVARTISLTLEAPQDDNAQRDYRLFMYETGSSKLISESATTVTFNHPGAPGLLAVPSSGNLMGTEAYTVSLTVDPASHKVGAYDITRTATNGETVLLTTLVPDTTNGDYDTTTVLNYTDVYTESAAQSITGGQTYTYEVVPRYTDLATDFRDQAKAVQEDAMILDLLTDLAPTADAVTVDWDETALAAAGYTEVRLERDGDVLRTLPVAEGSFLDTLTLYGVDHAYRVVALREGAPMLSQTATTQIAPNGSFAGLLLSATGNYVVPNTPLMLENLTASKQIGTLPTDAYGRLNAPGISYGASSDFTWTSPVQTNLTEADFTLGRYSAQVSHQWMHYDTAYTVLDAVGLLTDSAATSNDQGLVLSWTAVPDASISPAPTVFASIYRDGDLIGVVHDASDFTDSTATVGLHDYQLELYYFASGSVHAQSVDFKGQEFKAPVAPNTYVLDITNWGFDIFVHAAYPASPKVDYLAVKRVDRATDIPYPVLTFTPGETIDFYDSLAWPQTEYDYYLEAHTHGGDVVVLDQGYSLSQSLTASTIISQGQAQVVSSGVELTFETTRDYYQGTNWDGIRITSDVSDYELVLDKSTVLNVASRSVGHFTVNYPAVTVADGQLFLEVYKYTDRGFYFTNKLAYSFTGATVAMPAGTVPTAPSLATSGTIVQTPVLSASKDIRDRIMVTWTYPDYADVEFHLKWRAVGTTPWTELVLPNEQRAFLHENLPATQIEYILSAKTRKSDEFSDEVWDYGQARQYYTVEGLVTNPQGIPQASTFVSLNGAWTLTDSAGHYRLADLELATGSQTLEGYYGGEAFSKSFTFAPGEGTMQRVDFTLPSTTVAGRIRGHEAIWGLNAYPDPDRMANELRWTLPNIPYSGVKVYQHNGDNEVADIAYGEEMVWVDYLTESNPAGVQYMMVPYLTNALGEKVLQTDYLAVTTPVDYPVLQAPTYMDAFTNVAQGYVELTWGHTRNTVDGYVILRNDEEIGRVSASESAHFIDETGIPNQVYRYAIHGYLTRNGQDLWSTRATTALAQYPLTGDVTNLVATVGPVEGG